MSSTTPASTSRTTTSQQQQSAHTLFVGARRALVGGLLAAAVTLGGQLLVGQVYNGAEARSLLQAFVPSARSVGTAVAGASATILALMLTMLGLTRKADNQLDRVFYKRVERIGLLSTIALAGSALLLLLLSIPLDQSQHLPGNWYSYLYYTLIGATAALAGLLVAIVLMLYNAIQSLIQVISPDAYSAGSGSGDSSAGSDSSKQHQGES